MLSPRVICDISIYSWCSSDRKSQYTLGIIGNIEVIKIQYNNNKTNTSVQRKICMLGSASEDKREVRDIIGMFPHQPGLGQ